MTSAKVSATDRDVGGNPRSREVHRGSVKKASFTEDRRGRELEFGEVKRAWRQKTRISGGMMQHTHEGLRQGGERTA